MCEVVLQGRAPIRVELRLHQQHLLLPLKRLLEFQTHDAIRHALCVHGARHSVSRRLPGGQLPLGADATYLVTDLGAELGSRRVCAVVTALQGAVVAHHCSVTPTIGARACSAARPMQS